MCGDPWGGSAVFARGLRESHSGAGFGPAVREARPLRPDGEAPSGRCGGGGFGAAAVPGVCFPVPSSRAARVLSAEGRTR